MLRRVKRKIVGAYRALREPRDRSQHGEVTILRQILDTYECEPFIVDVGAHDGISLSNSLPFIESGWRAVLVEASPFIFEKLKANHTHRAGVNCVNVACSNVSGEADLYIGNDGPDGFLSTLSTEDSAWYAKARSDRTVRVKTDTLTSILRHADAPKSGILLVDCEGLDYQVLCGLDFSAFRPVAIITEEYELNTEMHAAKYSLLIRNGYSLFQKAGCNTVWVDRNATRRPFR